MHKLKLVSTSRTIEYDDSEAASRLGVTVEQLRSVVRERIAGNGFEARDVYTYRPADLVVLRMLMNSRTPVIELAEELS